MLIAFSALFEFLLAVSVSLCAILSFAKEVHNVDDNSDPRYETRMELPISPKISVIQPIILSTDSSLHNFDKMNPVA